jgi:hypothetical protein
VAVNVIGSVVAFAKVTVTAGWSPGVTVDGNPLAVGTIAAGPAMCNW